MDGEPFDALTRFLAATPTRPAALSALLAAVGLPFPVGRDVAPH